MKKTKMKKLGEYLEDVRYNPKKIKQKASGQSEGTNADGGYLVQQDQYPSILSPNFAEGSLYSKCKIINIGDNANGLKLPVSAETSRTTSGIKGGILSYWGNEAATKTATAKAQFDQLNLSLNKLYNVTYVTDEMAQDAPSFAGWLSDAFAESMMWQIDRAILYGSAQQINGVLHDGDYSTKYLTIDGTQETIEDAVKQYYGGENGMWVISKSLFNTILDNMADTFLLDLSSKTLMGYPYVVSDVMNDGDIVLGDFSQFIIIQKEIREDVDQSLKFLEDESCYRAVIRINGGSLWKSGGITDQSGSKVYPFVANTGSDNSSSSSSSSSSSEFENYSTSSESSASSSSSSSSEFENYSTSSESSVSSSSSSEEYSESSASTQSESSSSESSQNYSESSSESSQNYSESSSTSSSSSADAIFVKGTLNPDAVGEYTVNGTYNGEIAYERTDGSYWIWYDSGSDEYRISTEPNDIVPQWVLSGNVASGTYTADNGATGDATVTTEE